MASITQEIDMMVERLKEMKEANYRRYGYEEPMYERPAKIVDYAQTPFRHSVDFKTYQSDMKKRAKYEKTKPGNARVIDYGEDEECKKVDILTDNIFARGDEVAEKREEIKVDELTSKKLWNDIDNFLKKKRMILSDGEMELIRKKTEDPLFERSKYIKYSKTTQMISQLHFIHKMVDDTYQVIFEEEEEKTEEDREKAAADKRANMVDKKKKYVSKSFFKK
jgi:hypothetical protein